MSVASMQIIRQQYFRMIEQKRICERMEKHARDAVALHLMELLKEFNHPFPLSHAYSIIDKMDTAHVFQYVRVLGYEYTKYGYCKPVSEYNDTY